VKMVGFNSLEGTSAWLRGQLQNPGDIFNLLLLIGGDVLRTAIAQLSAGPVPYLTPVSFSFGWVSSGVTLEALRELRADNSRPRTPSPLCSLL
jgi:hypothetical protein